MSLKTPIRLMLLLCVSVLASTACGLNVTFGHTMLPLFALDPEYTNINFGSYGSPPRAVLERERYWENRMESNPDLWFRYEYQPLLDATRIKVANFVGANPKDLVFVENASHGINAVVRTLDFKQGDKILSMNIAYAMVKSLLRYTMARYGVELVQANVTFPSTTQQILEVVENTIKQHGASIKFASFDHMSSTPSVILPAKELVALCRKYNIIVLLDGAHCMGHISLNIPELDADFYISNGHKWLYSPKGSAILWTNPRLQSITHPLVISEGYGDGYHAEFDYQGTKNISPFLSMGDAIDWRESIGGNEQILPYIHNLAITAGKKLAAMWGTELLVPESMSGAIVNVRLPTTNTTAAFGLVEPLLLSYNTYLVVFAFQDAYYARLSAQIFNELSDFEYVGNAVLTLLRQ